MVEDCLLNRKKKPVVNKLLENIKSLEKVARSYKIKDLENFRRKAKELENAKERFEKEKEKLIKKRELLLKKEAAPILPKKIKKDGETSSVCKSNLDVNGSIKSKKIHSVKKTGRNNNCNKKNSQAMDVESGINSTMINESTCVDGSEMLEENFANGKNKGETKSNIKIKNNYLLTNFFTVKPEIKNKLIFHKNEDKMDEETEKITQPEFFKRNLGCLKMSDWSEERVNKFEQNTLHIFHSFSKNQNSNQLKFSFGKAAKGYESIENIKTNLISKLKNNKKIDSEERTKKRMILQKTQMANDEQLGSDKKIVPEENPENTNKNPEDMIITENKTLISINYQKNNINNNIEFAEDFLKNPTNFVNSQKKGRKI